MEFSFLVVYLVSALFAIFPTQLADRESGYVMYCPCMGRFGNQVDHLLGSLAFAKKLNRTLVVPPWINHDYATGYKNSFIPYDRWFNIDTLKQFHKVVLMEDFMNNMTPELWNSPNRKVYCHKISMERSHDKKSCPAKEGNPFGEFWNNFNIDFVLSEIFPSHLSYYSSKKEWDKAYPTQQNLVLVFMGAPASYPVDDENRKLQTYLEWSDDVRFFASNFISTNLKRPFIGIHLRIGADWKRACEHVKGSSNYPFMSSPQCVGPEENQANEFTKEMCYPHKETLIKQTLKIVKQHHAKSFFIATDSESYKQDFEDAFTSASLVVDVVQLGYDSVIKDIAILIEADNFLGSCASSVAGFVVRKRKLLGKPYHFLGVVADNVKSEL